jgi:hypothetical protein
MKLLRRNDSGDEGVTATVTLRDSVLRAATEREVPVKTLAELYAACREAARTGLVEVTLRGPAGEVSLKFGNLMRDAPRVKR